MSLSLLLLVFTRANPRFITNRSRHEVKSLCYEMLFAVRPKSSILIMKYAKGNDNDKISKTSCDEDESMTRRISCGDRYYGRFNVSTAKIK